MSGWISYDSEGRRQEWRPPTEDGVARKLAEAEAGRLRYCHDARAWFHWDGALWRRDRTGVAAGRVRDLARGLARDPGGAMSAAPWRPGFVAGALRLAAGEPALAVTAADWDADPFLLGTPAGPVDLRTGASLPADPGDGISRATAVAPAPPGTACPAWHRFLAETFGADDALIAFVQRYLGYALTGCGAEQAALFGWGASGTGKSTLLATVLHVCGSYAATAELATLSSADGDRHGRELARLAGARLVAVADGEGTWSRRRLARLTGGDPLPGAGLARLPKLLVMSGRPPAVEADATMRRRLRVVPFRCVPATPDRWLAETLLAEAPAILRWMIDGCLAWQADGLGEPPAVAAATADCLEAQDAIGLFLAARCTLRPNATAAAGDLWRAWRAFAEESGEAAGAQRAFAGALTARGFERDRRETARFYRGLGLTPDAS